MSIEQQEAEPYFAPVPRPWIGWFKDKGGCTNACWLTMTAVTGDGVTRIECRHNGERYTLSLGDVRDPEYSAWTDISQQWDALISGLEHVSESS